MTEYAASKQRASKADSGGPGGVRPFPPRTVAASGRTPPGVPECTFFSIIEHKEGSRYDTGTYERFSHRVARYGRAVIGGTDLVAFLKHGDRVAQRAGDKLRECGSWLEFRQFVTLPEQPIKLGAGVFCQQWRLCQLCALRRSAKLVKAFAPKLAELVRRGLRPYMVTLTQPGGDDLAERFESLLRALKGCMEGRKFARMGRIDHAWAIIEGAVFSVECKRGGGSRGGGWHVHMHGVIFVREDLWDVEAAGLVEAWCEQTGESNPRAQDVRPLRSTESADLVFMEEAGLVDLVGADLLEVFKYPMKFGDLGPADRWLAARALFGRHMLRTYGDLRGVRVDPGMLDAPLEPEDLPYVMMLLRWQGDGFRMAKRVFVDGASKKDYEG